MSLVDGYIPKSSTAMSIMKQTEVKSLGAATLYPKGSSTAVSTSSVAATTNAYKGQKIGKTWYLTWNFDRFGGAVAGGGTGNHYLWTLPADVNIDTKVVKEQQADGLSDAEADAAADIPGAVIGEGYIVLVNYGTGVARSRCQAVLYDGAAKTFRILVSHDEDDAVGPDWQNSADTTDFGLRADYNLNIQINFKIPATY